jgi:serine protease
MRRQNLSACAAVLAATLLAFTPSQASEEYNPFAGRERASVATDRVIVQLRAAAPAVAVGKPAPASDSGTLRISEVGQRTGIKVRSVRELGTGMHVVQIEPGPSRESLEAALDRLRADPAVEFAEPDARMRPHRVPNDPGFVEQWFLQPTVTSVNGPTASAVDAVSAWNSTLGAPSVVVAVIDTGVRFEHPDLQRVADGGKLLPGYDFVSAEPGGTARVANDGDGWDPDPSDPGDWISSADRQVAQFEGCPIDSSSWHGTRVAGMLAGLTDNGVGVAGVGWDNRVLPVRVLGKCGGLTSDIIAGMRWAAGLPQQGAPANPTPARILNLSLGGEGACSSVYQAAIDEITARGVLVVVSAGNDGSLVDQPANCRGVVSVTGVRQVGTKVGFANLGPDVTIAAPGGNCVNVRAGEPCLYSLDTTTNLGLTTPGASGYTDRINNINVGTSFASPIVSGIAALMYSVNGRLTPAQLAERMQASASPFPVSSVANVPTCRIPASSDDLQLTECNCTTSTCGSGLAQAPAAVAAALRPIALVSAPLTANAGETVSLSDGGSVGANGRTITGYGWTLVSGATSLSAVVGSQTSFVAPGSSGNVVVRLTVTDDEGSTDSVDATISVAGTPQPPPSPPPTTPPVAPDPGGTRTGSGGGGSIDLAALALALLLPWLARGSVRSPANPSTPPSGDASPHRAAARGRRAGWSRGSRRWSCLESRRSRPDATRRT